MSYASLRNQIVKRRPDLSIQSIDRAYEFAKKAHDGQKRYSGEAYIAHPVEVARILLELNPDLPAMQAALLHDITEDTAVERSQIEEAFGSEVATLVAGLEKLAIVKVLADKPQEEKWKKMFLAMAKDIRIVFIKLADRLHNMRTLAFVPQYKQERIARETLGVHAAIAARLGIFQIKSELEDLCFRYLYPEEYRDLAKQLKSEQDRSKKYMAFAISKLTKLLNRENINILEVQGRQKHLWSIYQKMQKKEIKDLGDIYDLFALRVILPDVFRGQREQFSHIYEVLGLVHAEYIPLQDRFKDYIALPKLNGYRSLHTTVLGLGGDIYDEPTEVQIRTLEMHKEAEIGIASHWTYKLSKGKERKLHGRRKQGIFTSHSSVEEQMVWLHRLAEKGDLKAEINLYPDRIFTLTPQRQIIELPLGANPIDFAYAVHTEVGNQMVNAKVDGRIVSFDYELKNGEIVEIVTRSNAKPSRNWLSIAKTSSARSKIKNWLNKQEKSLNLGEAQETINPELQVLAKARKRGDVIVSTEYIQEVLVTGEKNLPVILSACCKPKPPHFIIGYVSRGQFIRIHKQDCRELGGLERERFVSAHWKVT